MSTTGPQKPPAVPPRPSRSQDRDSAPKIPPRPVNRRFDRSVSPNPDRFAPSPLAAGPFPPKNERAPQHLNVHYSGNSIDRPQSVEMPSVGEEGKEYEALAEGADDEISAPERTHTVGEDVKLFAPKPSLPAQSAKQRFMNVTRTDSDKAASFGIGRPTAQERGPSSSNLGPGNKDSVASQLSVDQSQIEDEQGIPEIGQQVPMYPDAGDVQAPSPGPLSEGRQSNNHNRKSSSLNLPPGSYGLHGHGVGPTDRLEKAYFDKHPELLEKEHTPHHYDRPNDFSMSSEALDKIVHETANHGTGLASAEYEGTPSEQIGWRAIEESTSHPPSAAPHQAEQNSPPEKSPESGATAAEANLETHASEEGDVIHVDPGRTPAEISPQDLPEEKVYTAPILAEDELLKHPSPYDHHAAVDPLFEHQASLEAVESTSVPLSRVGSQPSSLRKVSSSEPYPTSADKTEYEPLFPDGEKSASAGPPADPKLKALKAAHKQRFPSRDIWEDAPDSAYYTADVSTPEVLEEPTKAPKKITPPPRDDETPAQAFARRQEELAEKEADEHGPDSFLPGKTSEKPIWAQQQSHLAAEKPRLPTRRFPSRDVWEDAPDSLRLETTVSTPQQNPEPNSAASDTKPAAPQRPTRKPTDPSSSSSDRPAVPQRPKPKMTPSEEHGVEPGTSPFSATSSALPPMKPLAVLDKPKPQIPTRPAKAGPTSGGLEPGEAAAPPKQKPAVPTRTAGSKIAALQAGFMSDLNKKLGLGPRAHKKDDGSTSEEGSAEQQPPKEKVPLSDARKGRARGPQRRAPAAKSASPAAAPKAEEPAKATALGVSSASVLYAIDPEDGEISVGGAGATKPRETTKAAATEAEPVGARAAGGDVSSKDTTDSDDGVALTRSPEAEVESPVLIDQHVVPTARDGDPVEQRGESSSEGKEEGKHKTLATNMAGEPVLEEEVKVNEEDAAVEPIRVEEE